MILVAGPPCGGKTTYARTHATGTILDFDDIIERITGDRYSRDPSVITQARSEWSARLPNTDWVIWTAPRRAQRGRLRTQHHATVIIVTASIDECLRRAADNRPESWPQAIRNWFNQWQPSRTTYEQIIDTTTIGSNPTMPSGTGEP